MDRLKKFGLLFSGQGAQFVGIGRDLVEISDRAADLFDKADELLDNNFKRVCFEGPEPKLTETRYCQPALYVHGVALLEILRRELPDFEFAAAAGLSLGEITAHTAAGHISFEEGLKLVAERGRLMQEACSQTEGGMLSLLGVGMEECQEVADKSGLEVANINCPGQIVLSGPKRLISKAMDVGKKMGLRRMIPLKVAGAYHSKLMESAQAGLKPMLDEIMIQDSDVVVYSNVTAEPVQGNAAIKDTLLRQVTATVHWQQCIENMIRDGVEHFIELGPGKILAGMCKRITADVPCSPGGKLEEIQHIEGLVHELKR